MARHWFTSYLTNFYSQNKKIGLDIGCGKQPYKQIYNCEYVGIDFPNDQMKNISTKPNAFSIGEYLPFGDNTFDFVTCNSVIPYVEKIDLFLDELHRVTKPEGIAVISIMNLKALTRDPHGYYPNKFSSKQLEKKLSKHGFKSVKNKNLKAWFWSIYFDSTSVYSYAIVQCKKNTTNTKTPAESKRTDLSNRQIARSKVIQHSTLYNFSKRLYRMYCSATHNLHVLPDFLIIGGAKCGTSSLYDYLMEHPSMGKSLTKQIHFFDRYYDRNISWYKVCFPLKWQKFFIEKIKKLPFCTGEATPHYMTHPLASERAHKIIPNTKIIVMLRNPVDRAYSHYNMEKDHNNEDLSFEDACKKEPERIKGEIDEMSNNQNNSGRNYPHRAYLKSGEYFEQIERWLQYFPKENFYFVDSEEFNKYPSKVYNEVLAFLGLPPFELKKYEKIRKRNYEKMKPETRKNLIEYFLPQNKKLYDYLGIDFGWDK